MTGQGRPALAAIPFLAHENLYVGVDVGKKAHVAAFVSRTLLETHRRYESCPVLKFENSRSGFQALLTRIGEYVPPIQAYVLLEKTGHYQRALRQFLLDCDITVHEMHVTERQREMTKTDKRDAQRLANHLYNQLELHAQVADKKQVVRQALPDSRVARELHRLVQNRAEQVRECTRCKNKLTAICDQLFPELTGTFKDPNGQTALAIRAKYPTAHAVAVATLPDLCALRTGTKPSAANLERLRHLAAQTIGVRDVVEQRALVFEQAMLIEQLRLLQRNVEKLEAQIEMVVTHRRERRILTSIPGIGTQMAAVLIASIGNVLNFPTAGDLKAYLGWSAQDLQTGTTTDRSRLCATGTRATRSTLYLAVAKATCLDDNQWARLYHRLVPKKCAYDDRKRDYVSCATAALIVAILALTRPAPLAGATGIPHGPVPRIDAYPALYRYEHTRWQRTAVLRKGDLARFTLLFRWNRPGWHYPSAVLQVWRLSPRGMDYGPALYTLPLRRERWSQGFTRFSGTLRIGRNGTGPLEAAFELSNGRGAKAGVA